jgi:hypothetical protein
MKTLYTLVAAATISLGAGAASATVYDYTGSATNPGGPTLTCAEFGLFNDSCSVTYNADGLGVNGSPDFQPDQVDGSPLFSSERLTFDFGRDLVWRNITFGRWDSNDDARLTWATGTTTWGPNAGNSVDLGNVVSQYLTVTAYGDLFGGDYCGFLCGNDSFTVASIEVVPLPAAGWMLLAGLGGIAAMKRRKRAA